jgi:hypothetical protein
VRCIDFANSARVAFHDGGQQGVLARFPPLMPMGCGQVFVALSAAVVSAVDLVDCKVQLGPLLANGFPQASRREDVQRCTERYCSLRGLGTTSGLDRHVADIVL